MTIHNLFEIKSLPLVHQGKVRDIYAIDEHTWLMISTDRVSAFDVVLPNLIPNKGVVLTNVSKFWFDFMKPLTANHLLPDFDLASVLSEDEYQRVHRHSIVVKKLKPLKVEAIVRGYLIGSGWKDYQKNGSVCGITLAEGLQQAQQLPEPIYTPSTKADVGEHDENISYEQTIDILGQEMAEKVRDLSLMLYSKAAEFARAKGIIIADTKFEFGLDEHGELTIMDEALTPDSSRFWDESTYEVGTSPESYDKQIVRDHLEQSTWDKKAPGPELPDKIIEKAQARYEQLEAILTR